jgi:hypothetical protein
VTAKTVRVVKRWQFGWCDEDSPPANGDAHDWRPKTFRVATFEKAMDKMLAFVRGKPFVVLVDYECAARHVPYDPERHEETFHRIDETEHDLKEYLS